MRLQPQVTKIQADVTFRQRRQLPGNESGTVLARPGQEVSVVQVVAQMSRPAGFYVLEVETEFGLSAKELEKHLLVGAGSEVRNGTPIFEKKKRFGRTRIIESPYDGVVEEIRGGRIFIRRRPVEQEVRALLEGYVVYIIQNRGVAIETRATRIEGLVGSREEGFGQFKMLAQNPGEKVDRDAILNSIQGSVIGLGFIDDVNLIKEGTLRGGKGFIVGSVSEEIFAALPSFKVPVIVTDGIGRFGMSTPVFDRLSQVDGRGLSLLAPAHSFSERPFIVIPAKTGAQTPAPDEIPVLAAGRKVRVLREPFQPQVGEIVSIYPYPKEKTYFGAHVPSAEVRLPSGDVILVPCANLDIIM